MPRAGSAGTFVISDGCFRAFSIPLCLLLFFLLLLFFSFTSFFFFLSVYAVTEFILKESYLLSSKLSLPVVCPVRAVQDSLVCAGWT